MVYLFSYLTYIKLSTAIKRNESMAKSLQKALLQQQRSEEDGKRTARPQDLIRLYDIILQVMLGKADLIHFTDWWTLLEKKKTKKNCIKWRSANELPMKSEEQLGTSSNLLGDVQHLHGIWKNSAFSCEQKMLLERACLFLHSNAAFQYFFKLFYTAP